MTKISELGLCKNECCADKIRAAMKAGTAYGRATPTLSAAMELPEVRVLVEAAALFADSFEAYENAAVDHMDFQASCFDALFKIRAALAQLKETKP